MADIFSVQPPAWLTEVSLGDPTHGTDAANFSAGVHAAQAQSANRLQSLRSQAVILQSAARIQSLENANTLAMTRLEATKAQMDIARERLELNKEAAARKTSDVQGFHNGWNSLNAVDRQEIDQVGDWTSQGPSIEQWNLLNNKLQAKREADAAALKDQGLTPNKVTVKTPEGTTVFEKPETGDKPEFLTVGDRQFMRWGRYKWDLSAVGTADKVELDLAKHRIDRLEKAILDNPKDVDLKRQAVLARTQLQDILKRNKVSQSSAEPTTPAQATSITPSVAPAAKVKVEKDGKQFLLPAAQLPDALKAGYTEVK